MERAEDKTILVVDDEPNVRQYLMTVLQDAGFNVVTAGDGVEALEMIKRSIPDFISLEDGDRGPAARQEVGAAHSHHATADHHDMKLGSSGS